MLINYLFMISENKASVSSTRRNSVETNGKTCWACKAWRKTTKTVL